MPQNQIPLRTNVPTQEELNKIHNTLRENAEYLFVEVEQRAQILSNHIISENQLAPKHLNIEIQGSKELGDMFIKQSNLFIKEGCYWLILGVVGLRRSKGDSLYITGIEFRSLRDKVFSRIRDISIEIQKASPLPLPANPEATKEVLISDLAIVQKAIVKCCSISSETIQDKITPLTEWFCTKYGIDISRSSLVIEAASGKMTSDTSK